MHDFIQGRIVFLNSDRTKGVIHDRRNNSYNFHENEYFDNYRYCKTGSHVAFTINKDGEAKDIFVYPNAKPLAEIPESTFKRLQEGFHRKRAERKAAKNG